MEKEEILEILNKTFLTKFELLSLEKKGLIETRLLGSPRGRRGSEIDRLNWVVIYEEDTYEVSTTKYR